MIALDRVRREVDVAAFHNDDGSEVTPERVIPYDTLVMAVGSLTNDFATPGARHTLTPSCSSSRCVAVESRAGSAGSTRSAASMRLSAMSCSATIRKATIAKVLHASLGKLMKASTSASASSIMAASLGTLGLS